MSLDRTEARPRRFRRSRASHGATKARTDEVVDCLAPWCVPWMARSLVGRAERLAPFGLCALRTQRWAFLTRLVAWETVTIHRHKANVRDAHTPGSPPSGMSR